MHLMRMDAQNPPSKIARLADSGGFDFASKMKGNLGSINDGKDTTPIRLGLELGRGSYGVQKPSFQRSSGFTFLQFQELEHQSLIYKYMEAGLPVPYHLVLPIWKSLSGGSVGSCNGGLCPSRYHPTFASPLNLNYQSIQDPEPGRCKRTDGKKWRCSKEAVRDFKYCERHMHRGRHQRSRKHVETEPNPSDAATSSTNSRDLLHSGTNLTISLQAPMSSTTSNVSPRLVFSPTSVLQGGAKRTDPS